MLVVSDRISAFDFIMPNPVPEKGIILNKLSEFWFNYLKDIVPNHIISTNIEEFPDEFKNKQFERSKHAGKKIKNVTC